MATKKYADFSTLQAFLTNLKATFVSLTHTEASVGQVLSVKSVEEDGTIEWETISPESVGGSVVTDPTLSIDGAAADAKTTGNRLTSVEDQIADLMYKPISITSFTNNISTVEKGSIVASATLNWTTNKTPSAIVLDDEVISDPTVQSITINNMSLTSNKTWTLKATDERDEVVTRTTTINFLNGVYFGESNANDDFNEVMSGLSKRLQSTPAIEFSANASRYQHIAYALPTSYKTPTFKDKDTGFEAGFYKAATINFTNSSGYEESYDIWLSTQTGLGAVNIVVS